MEARIATLQSCTARGRCARRRRGRATEGGGRGMRARDRQARAESVWCAHPTAHLREARFRRSVCGARWHYTRHTRHRRVSTLNRLSDAQRADQLHEREARQRAAVHRVVVRWP